MCKLYLRCIWVKNCLVAIKHSFTVCDVQKDVQDVVLLLICLLNRVVQNWVHGKKKKVMKLEVGKKLKVGTLQRFYGTSEKQKESTEQHWNGNICVAHLDQKSADLEIIPISIIKHSNCYITQWCFSTLCVCCLLYTSRCV